MSRSVLLMGDDALYVYNVTGRGAKLVDTVPWAAEDFAEVVSTLIRRECGGKSVLILNDMTDQNFKNGQRLPKVGPMDRGNVLQRRLTVAFPNNPIRGAIAIKEATGGEPGMRPKMVAGGLYLFVGVPMSEPVAKTFDAVKRSMAPISGFVLLPVEATDMVNALATASAEKGRGPAEWTIFIGQHQNGSLRQVITRNGQLALTRMTSVADSDANPTAWAEEVAQEFRATVSYLSRYGYSAEDGTDIIVITGADAGTALEKRIGIPCNYTNYTAQEAARELGIALGFQDDDRYADALHAAWAGRKSKFLMPLQAQDLANIHKPRQAVAAVMGGMVLGAGYLAWMLLSQGNSLISTKSELSQSKKTLREVTAVYDSETARMQSLGFDVKLVQGAINTYQGFENDGMHTLAQLKKIREAMGNELRLDALRMSRTPPVPAAAGAEPKYDENGKEIKPRPRMEAVLQLSFPPTVAPEIGAREVEDLERRLKAAFPGYVVAIEKQVEGMDFDENFTGQVGAMPDAERTEDTIAVLSIKGAL
jgi:hypothetical protein